MYQRQGFTLIELLVVVLIIGILSAVALPQYQKAVAKARYTEAKQVLKSLMEATQLYILANDDVPADINDLDITPPSSNHFTYSFYRCINAGGQMGCNLQARPTKEGWPDLHTETKDYDPERSLYNRYVLAFWEFDKCGKWGATKELVPWGEYKCVL